ncbi:MAG TPA: adenylate/guanylate cyclase domain-containing protein [Candidatus Krumholzibacteria bacterium]|nr:adenylate/guanylate cyclase domain-containing protein [Candidatus Krumholzibacteria bacterium]HPD71866.1 adenylate/guanylate cyclase domain-containing protein [Candidatus Krumholzibacteria bacterium]HRY41201.1 adenylate/guanylate cyclase domain-containing protein [Candidatus Krumholzibacteria bacterium]
MARWRLGLAAGLAAGVLAAGLWLLGALDRAENLTWDWRVRRAAEPSAAASRIKLILLDQASLDWGRETGGWSWPWPREVYSAVLDFCRRGGARTVSFDLVFTEPSVYGVWDDEALGAALAARSDAIVACHVATDGTITWPVPEVRTGSARLGNVSGQPDPDGVFRRVRPAVAARDTVIEGLGLAAYRLAGGAAVPDSSVILRFAPAGTYAVYSAAAVIQSELRLRDGENPVLDPEVLRDAHVFFAGSAPGLLDQRPTPLSRISPGVVVHATVLDNLLAGRFIAPAPRAIVLVATLLAGAVAGWLAVRVNRAWIAALLFVIGLPLPLGAGLLLYGSAVWWPVMPGTLAVAGGLVGGLGANWATEGRQRRFLKQAFRHYLSPAVVDRLVQDPGRLRLGGERRELTIYFSDLAGFTGLGERLDPEALTALLNDYLTAMTDIVLAEGGTLDKYEGDAIIAFWNAPLDVPDHAVRACRAAILCQRELAEHRAELRERCGHDLSMRVGLHTGPVVVGNLGSKQRFDYSILGDAANLASRLEGVNKVFGTGILASETTVRAAGAAILARELGRVKVVGRREPVTVYELGGLAGEVEPAHWRTYHEALDLCRAGKGEVAHRLLAGLTSDPAARALAAQLAADLDFRGLWELDQK